MSADGIVPANPGPQPYLAVDAQALAGATDLSAATRRLAPLFDGRHSAAQRLQAAREQRADASPAQLAEATMDLALAGLLEPGRLEPLPSPVQLEEDPWGRAIDPQRSDSVVLPALVAGSLAQPGLPGAIGGTFGGRHRGWDDQVDYPLPPRVFAAIGAFFAAPALRPWRGWAMLALVAGGVIAMWNVHHQVEITTLRMLRLDRLFVIVGVVFVFNNVAQSCSRLAATGRTTGQWPAFGLVFGLKIFPRLFTSSAGPAENAGRSARGQILLAPLMSLLLLTLLAQLGWFLTRLGPGLLPEYFLAQATLSLIQFLFAANPLARRDGYHWLANHLGVPDLREQARMSLFGRERSWVTRPPPSRRVRMIYAIAAITYLLAVLVYYLMFPAHLLERRFGGAGVVAALAWLSFSTYRRSRRDFVMRTSLEPFRVKLPTLSRTTWIVIGVVVLVLLLPYPYDPSGNAVVLPHDRAEVRALVPGDVEKVLAHEGDLVKAGQELLQISDVQAKAFEATAAATLTHAQSELAIVKKGGASNEVQLAREKLETAKKRQEFAQSEADRLQQAYSRHAVSPQAYDTARGAAEVRKQEVAEAQQELKVIGNPARDERIAALEADVVKAQADLDYAQQQLDNTHVRAPIDGRVVSEKLLFARGVYLAVGALVAYVEDTRHLQAEVKLPEAALGDIASDAKAWVRVWAFPGSSFAAKVVEIAPDAEQGEYGKVVRVRVQLDDPPAELKPEMTGEAKVRSHWTIVAIAFTHALVRFVMVEVWSWLP